MLYLKYVAEAVGLIISIFPFWFYRQGNQAWDGEETCLTLPGRPGSTKVWFFMADGKAL